MSWPIAVILGVLIVCVVVLSFYEEKLSPFGNWDGEDAMSTLTEKELEEKK